MSAVASALEARNRDHLPVAVRLQQELSLSKPYPALLQKVPIANTTVMLSKVLDKQGVSLDHEAGRVGKVC